MNYNDNEYKQRFDTYKHSESFYGENDVISIGQWVLILIGTAIPIIGFIVTLVLAFGTQNETLKNYGRAALILIVIGIFLSVLLGACSI